MKTLIDKLIAWLCRRSAKIVRPHGWETDYIRVVNKQGELSIKRFCPLFFDRPWIKNKFNILLHCWTPTEESIDDLYGQMHDHPRWSITIVLKGDGLELTPWNMIRLKPGKIIFRGRKAIHQLQPTGTKKLWTLFIVGPWKHKQNYYQVAPIKTNNDWGKE